MLQMGRQSEDGWGLKGPSSKSKTILDTHANTGSFKNSTLPCYTQRPGSGFSYRAAGAFTAQKSPVLRMCCYWLYNRYYSMYFTPCCWQVGSVQSTGCKSWIQGAKSPLPLLPLSASVFWWVFACSLSVHTHYLQRKPRQMTAHTVFSPCEWRGDGQPRGSGWKAVPQKASAVLYPRGSLDWCLLQQGSQLSVGGQQPERRQQTHTLLLSYVCLTKETKPNLRETKNMNITISQWLINLVVRILELNT